MASSGTGELKGAAIQNILVCNPSLPALFCQLKITGPLMFVCASPLLVRLRHRKPLFEVSCKVDREPTGQKQAREE